MRGRARSAAAALAAALALAAGGCKPSSLTPFGIGDRGPDVGQGVHSGAWEGTTGSGGVITFTVQAEAVQNIVLTHMEKSCALPYSFTIDKSTALIDEGLFSIETALEPQGKFAISGRVTAPDTAVGAYSFNAVVATGTCPTSGAGSFVSGKLPILNAQEEQP